MPNEISQGERIIFVISPVSEKIDYTFTLIDSKGREIEVVKGFNYYLYEHMISMIIGLGGIPSNLSPGEYKVKAVGRSVFNSYFFERPLTVKSVEYPGMSINGNSKMDDIIHGQIDEIRKEQSKRLWDAFSTFSPYILHEEGYLSMPVTGRHSSPFGFKRVTKFPNGKEHTSVHKGEDLAVKIGTPVLSDGRGRVLLAESRIVTGNSVVVEHLPGVVSIYYHMDSIDVSRGDFLEKGDKIGEVGTTGYSTGPHIHWEVRISTVPVDPMQFLTTPLIDKSLIMTMINSTNNKKGG